MRRFILVGIGNTALGLGAIFIARQFASEFAANFIGYLLVVPVSFLCHRGFSFRDRGSWLTAFLRYLPTIAAGYLANAAVLGIALQAGANPYFAQASAIASHVLVTFLLSRFFVFLHPETRA